MTRKLGLLRASTRNFPKTASISFLKFAMPHESGERVWNSDGPSDALPSDRSVPRPFANKHRDIAVAVTAPVWSGPGIPGPNYRDRRVTPLKRVFFGASQQSQPSALAISRPLDNAEKSNRNMACWVACLVFRRSMYL